MASVTTPGRPRRGWPWVVGVVVLAGLGVGWYGHTHGWWRPPAPKQEAVDMTAVMRANNEGVGHIERYEYVPAAEAFEKVVQLAPDWVPGRINLGITLLNLARGQTEQEKEASQSRAIDLFQEILRKEPDNPYAHYCLGIILCEGQSNAGEAALHFAEVTRLDPH